ncbi:MAG TPA: ATP-binding domain-containing protein [Kofleriaceae bacterium]|nr:ATP-binding domain-containing protein [Kofleriaceae bacterium]
MNGVSERVAALVGRALAAGGGGLAVFGHMRVLTGGRVRDLLLGSRALVERDLTVLDWRASPLAEVFFRHRQGDHYEIEVDGRELAGQLLERHLLQVERAGRVEILPPAEHPPGRPVRGGAGRAPVTVDDLDDDQRGAVLRPDHESVLVRGAAGVGKTLVALHRAAHLARRAAARGDVQWRAIALVPSEGLRRLWLTLWERLGEGRLEVASFDDWIAARARAAFRGLPARTSMNAPASVIRLKRHPAVAVALGELVAARTGVKTGRQDLLHLWGDGPLLGRILSAAGGELGERAIADALLHTRLQFTDVTEKQYRHVDADRLATVDGRAIDDGTPMEDAGSFDVEDCAILFALARRRGQSPGLERYDHIVLDEAQLIAPLELDVLRAALRPGGRFTVAGDERQVSDDSAWFAGWDATLERLGISGADRTELAHNYRSAPPIARAAEALAAGLPVAADGAHLTATRFAGEFYRAHALSDALDALAASDLTIGVIARDADAARRIHRELSLGLDPQLILDGAFSFEPGVVVTSVAEAQGLEFDVVVLPDASATAYPDTPTSRRALYVAMTRAVDWLWLTTVGSWSPPLAGV